MKKPLLRIEGMDPEEYRINQVAVMYYHMKQCGRSIRSADFRYAHAYFSEMVGNIQNVVSSQMHVVAFEVFPVYRKALAAEALDAENSDLKAENIGLKEVVECLQERTQVAEEVAEYLQRENRELRASATLSPARHAVDTSPAKIRREKARRAEASAVASLNYSTNS